jgi:hypothetical protein
MAPTLKFYGWQRSSVYDLASGALEDGRLAATSKLTLRNREVPADRVEHDLTFQILGPRDILGLLPGAIVAMMPPPNSLNADTTKCVFVELAAPDLPWRYTPRKHDGLALRPWIVLIVGTTEEVKLQAKGMVTFNSDVADAHNLCESARWAHVQDDGSRLITRLLSPRKLPCNAELIAAVVPAFNANGNDAWQPTAGATLPCYHFWRFRTGEEGDFKTLAARLKPGKGDPSLGRAPVLYARVDPPITVEMRGALAPVGGTDAPLPQPVADDMAALRTTPRSDSRGRPILTIPTYGAPWRADPTLTAWGAAANTDPRHRAAAGLGLWAGIELQEQIMEAATNQVGALDIAAQRIRQLTCGLLAARSLWRRRLPADPAQRLLLYGPALRRIMTTKGPLLGQIAGGNRPLAPSMFSSAARRALRRGPARTALADAKALDPAAMLQVANECPPEPERDSPGMLHTDRVSQTLDLPSLDDPVPKDGEKLADAVLAARFAQAAQDPQWADVLGPLRDRLAQRAQSLNLGEEPGGEEPPGPPVPPPDEPPGKPCEPVELPEIEPPVTDTIDPTGDNPVVKDRVLITITDLPEPKLAPTEVCIGIDYPIWTFLRDRAPDWLLPGVTSLEEDAVVAVESNATFVDAFLLGLNAQVLSELRWRNVPIATGCTPMHMFWGQIDPADPAANSHKADIRGVEVWPDGTPLGHIDHQQPPPVGTDLVLVVRSDLFRRFPQTVIYAAPAPLVDGEPVWTDNPPFTGERLLPTFQGSIGEDITFFRFDLQPQAARQWWIVLEEPPPGYGFRNDLPDEAIKDIKDGAMFAHVTFHNPVRVLLRGENLIPEH